MLNPHEFVEQAVVAPLRPRLGHLGLDEKLMSPLAGAVVERLSIYLEMQPAAEFSFRPASVQRDGERTKIAIELLDRGRRLPLKELLRRWRMADVDEPAEFVARVNRRRGQLVYRHTARFLAPLFAHVAETVARYYDIEHATVLHVGTHRFVEDGLTTHLVLEVDERRILRPADAFDDGKKERWK